MAINVPKAAAIESAAAKEAAKHGLDWRQTSKKVQGKLDGLKDLIDPKKNENTYNIQYIATIGVGIMEALDARDGGKPGWEKERLVHQEQIHNGLKKAAGVKDYNDPDRIARTGGDPHKMAADYMREVFGKSKKMAEVAEKTILPLLTDESQFNEFADRLGKMDAWRAVSTGILQARELDRIAKKTKEEEKAKETKEPKAVERRALKVENALQMEQTADKNCAFLAEVMVPAATRDRLPETEVREQVRKWQQYYKAEWRAATQMPPLLEPRLAA